MQKLEQFIKIELKNLKDQNLLRTLKNYNQDELVNFCSNDYFGLSQNKEVIKSAQEALEIHGSGSGSARLITGNNNLYDKLEKQLASYKDTESALVFGSGYLANIGIIPAIMSKGDLIIADKLVHSCILDGIKLSGANLKRFNHNDLTHLEKVVKKYRNDFKNCLIVTETVFSMDGDVAPLKEIIVIAKKYNCWTMSDDAHGIGIVDNVKTDLQMGTLSKAVGSYGGYVCCSRSLRDLITNKAKSFIYTTALPPSCLAAAIKSLEIIKNDKALTKKPLDNARYFAKLMSLDIPQSAIVPIITTDAKKAIDAADKLKNKGILVSAIRPPTVPKNTARLRITFSSLHTKNKIEKLASCLKEVL